MRYMVLFILCSALVACVIPRASYVHVDKSDRVMRLLDENQKPIRQFSIALGETPVGHKVQEGDGKTPEGLYVIDYKNPHSRFHKSLHISYPNETDKSIAAALGIKPGGDVVIHGVGNSTRARERGFVDWTWGCIAVRDHEINHIYAMVPVGTPILIEP